MALPHGRATRLAAAALSSASLAATVSLGAAAASPRTPQAGIAGACPVLPVRAIDGEIAQAQPGSTVIVCPGTYHGDIVVSKAVTLWGVGATIDAHGAPNGITIVASGATVQGFTVRGAIGEGILAVGKPGHPISHVTIRDNLVEGNDQGNPYGRPITSSRYRECNALGHAPGDCGQGIHLMVVTSSVVTGNTVVSNDGGILLSDEFGPSAHNVIQGNTIAGNLYDCGITLASHSSTAFAGGRAVPSAGGVYDNTVAGNHIAGNGMVPTGGSGVLLADALPGGAVYDNTVIGNVINANGHSGVTLHAHAPGEDLTGNVIERNTIGVNNYLGDPDFAPAVDMATTGVLVATNGSPLSVTVSGNSIIGDTNGIWWYGPVTMTGTNRFGSVTNQVVQG